MNRNNGMLRITHDDGKSELYRCYHSDCNYGKIDDAYSYNHAEKILKWKFVKEIPGMPPEKVFAECPDCSFSDNFIQ